MSFSALRQICVYYSEYIKDDYVVPLKKRHQKDCIVDKEKHDAFKLKGKSKFMNEKESKEFLEGFKKRTAKIPRKEEVYEVVANFQMFTGTRIGEVAAVRWEDVCLFNKTVLIHRSVTWSRLKGRKTFIANSTKTGVSRVVPLHADLVHLLRGWCLKSGRSTGLIFSHNGRTPLAYRGIAYRYDYVLKSIGGSTSSSGASRLQIE